jgi:outer membrane protein OmpA-like peptidoglycan-associated protein
VKAFAIALAFIVELCLSGCQSVTTLILMPDESGKVGAITVKTPSDIRLINEAYNSVTTKQGTSRLSETQALSEAQVIQEYAALLKAQPAKPTSIILYFVTGSTNLAKESLAIIPQVIDQIKAQMPTEISLIGHTDTTGTDNINDKLSLERAKTVEKILKDSMPTLNIVSIQSFGSKDLLVPTPPNVDEPRNRRVEILIL